MGFLASPVGLFTLGAVGVVLTTTPGYRLTHGSEPWLNAVLAGLAALGSYITGTVIQYLRSRAQ